MKEFDDYPVSMKIDFLQENELWADPGMDMSPAELNNFCNDLLTTHDVSPDDLQFFYDDNEDKYSSNAKWIAEANEKLSRVDVEKIQMQLQEAKGEVVEVEDDDFLDEVDDDDDDDDGESTFVEDGDVVVYRTSIDVTESHASLHHMISRAYNMSAKSLAPNKKLKIDATLFIPASEISEGGSLISVLKDYFGNYEVKVTFVATGFIFGGKTVANVMLNSDDYTGWVLEYDIGTNSFSMRSEYWTDDMVYTDAVEIVFEIHPVFD